MILTLAMCPVCGGEATAYAMRFTREGTQYAVGCRDPRCGVSTTFMPVTLEEAAERWNGGVGLMRGPVPVKRVGVAEMRMLEVVD